MLLLKKQHTRVENHLGGRGMRAKQPEQQDMDKLSLLSPLVCTHNTGFRAKLWDCSSAGNIEGSMNSEQATSGKRTTRQIPTTISLSLILLIPSMPCIDLILKHLLWNCNFWAQRNIWVKSKLNFWATSALLTHLRLYFRTSPATRIWTFSLIRLKMGFCVPWELQNPHNDLVCHF